MLKEFFIILCLAICIVRSINFDYDGEGGVEGVAAGLSEILIKFYSKSGSNLYFVTSVGSENQGKLNKLLENSLKILNGENSVMIDKIDNVQPLKGLRRSSNILIIDSIKNFEKICPKINSDNFRMRKLFTIVSLKSLSEEEMKEIFTWFMNKLLVNVNVLMRDDQNSINLFTFFPFAENQKCHNTNPVKINSFVFAKNSWQNENFLPKKSKNMQKCSLIFGAATKSSQPAILLNKKPTGEFELDGIEYQLMIEISKRLNLNPIFKIFNTSIGNVYENGSGDGVLGAVAKNEIDIGIGFCSLQILRTKLMSETKFYTVNALGIVGKQI